MMNSRHDAPQHVAESEFEDPVNSGPCEDADEFKSAGALDTLADHLGSAPWWVVSGTFHGLMLMLLTLIGLALTQVEKPNVAIDFIPKPPPKYIPLEKPTTFINNKPPVENLPTVENPVVFADETPVAEPEIPDETMEDFHDPKGDEGLTDLTNASSGINQALGLNAGGARKLGRPTGIGAKLRMAQDGGGGGHTENGVVRALRWLADHQDPDGHWDCVKYGGKKADVGTTGLALLAFLGAGHTEKISTYPKFKRTVRKAVAWLKSIQQEDGKFYLDGETHGIGYHHAIAGLAMVEAAGMAKIPDTIRSAQKGLDYSQNTHQKGEGSERLGWRYQAKSAKSDLSVSGWFIMQLKSAKIAKLQVDPAAFEGAIRFLDQVEQKGPAGDGYGGHRYGYTNSQNINHRRTAIGCLSRQFLGWENEELSGGIHWFVENGGVPSWGANGGSVDLYYWYYGSLCVFQHGGDIWKKWNAAMVKALLDNQQLEGDPKGSWDPVGAYAQYWGRAGQTALGALCLEVYYRYPMMLGK